MSSFQIVILLLFLMLLFGFPVLSWLGFLIMEFAALADAMDQFQTYSQYVKKWRRKHDPWASWVIGICLIGFFLSATALTVYLWGHFINEAW